MRILTISWFLLRKSCTVKLINSFKLVVTEASFEEFKLSAYLRPTNLQFEFCE